MNYPVKGFLQTSFSDWPGKVAAVLFLPGCNFRCPYCHNHGLVLHPEEYPDYPWKKIVAGLRDLGGWIDGVCVTGGEPTLHPWLPALLRDLRSIPDLHPPGARLGIKLDTNGSRPEALRGLLDEELLDYVAMDVKGPLEEEKYAAASGVLLGPAGLERIQASMRMLAGGKVDHEFRTTLVPSLIREEEVFDLARALQGAPRYTLQNFNPEDPLDPALRATPPFDEKDLRRMQARVNEIIKA